MVKLSLKDLARLAEEEYNRRRAPEAVLRVSEVDEDRGVVKVVIEGTFCLTCGVDDWAIDYAYELRKLGIESYMDRFELDLENLRAEATFVIKGKGVDETRLETMNDEV